MLTLHDDTSLRDLESRGLFREADWLRASCCCADSLDSPDLSRAIREAEADGDWELWFRLLARSALATASAD